MADEQVIKLLEEIRDLQKQHMENYKLALSNQQLAIATQKQAMARVRLISILIGGLILLLLLPVGWWGLTWATRCHLFR